MYNAGDARAYTRVCHHNARVPIACFIPPGGSRSHSAKAKGIDSRQEAPRQHHVPLYSDADDDVENVIPRRVLCMKSSISAASLCAHIVGGSIIRFCDIFDHLQIESYVASMNSRSIWCNRQSFLFFSPFLFFWLRVLLVYYFPACNVNSRLIVMKSYFICSLP